jgi:hypothetical protein
MMDLGVEFGISSMPTLVGFGGRRGERVTDRVSDTRLLADERGMGEWVDQEMKKGDSYPSSGGSGGGMGLLRRIFGS